jgi:hypothetical protein
MQRLLFWVAVIVLLPHLLRLIQWLLTAAFKLFLWLFVIGLLLKLIS